MASLILSGGENQFSWRITGLSAAFNQSGFIRAGITMYQFTQGGVSSISGIIDSIYAPSSGAATSTTTRYVSYEPGTYTFWGFTQVQSGSYWPVGSATVTITAPATVYKSTVQFNANGGSGALSSVSGQGMSDIIRITLPYTQPTRKGYIFVGWSTNKNATSAEYSPGGTYSFWGSATGYTHTLYAVWSINGGGAWIYTSGGFQNASVYIYTGEGWCRATPYIYYGGWSKCQ